LIDLFWKAYPVYKDFADEIYPEYSENEGLAIPMSLFPMHGLNKNRRSVGNVKIQGSGAAILMKLLELLQKWSLSKYGKPCVIAPLHDACYLEIPYSDFDTLTKDLVDIKSCFENAYSVWAKVAGKMKSEPPMIRVGGEVWANWINPENMSEVPLKEVSKGLYEGELEVNGMGVAVNTIHRDERISIADFLNYQAYLMPNNQCNNGF